MTDIERIEQRLTAVERTVTGDDVDLSELERVAERIDELEAVEARLEDLSERVASLEAEVEALGGYAAEVESVNTDVERQAYAAFATVDRLEEHVEEIGDRVEDLEEREPPGPVARDDAGGERAVDAAGAADAPGTADVTGSAGATGSGEVATTDGGEGSMGPFVPATPDEEPAADGGSAADATADSGPSLTEAVRNEENGDGESTTDRSSVDELFEGTEESDEAEGSSDGSDDDGGFLDALRAKLS